MPELTNIAKGREPQPPEVELALGLSGRTETEVALEWGVTRAAVSKDVVKVLRLTQLEDSPAWGAEVPSKSKDLQADQRTP
jgi:hypothetical protein